MKCKKSLMGLAGILILIFHFYMPLTKTPIELTLYRASYIGVDIFFFLSAYSLAVRKIDNYKSYIVNRLMSVYLPFVLFSAIAAVYGSWKSPRFFKVIFGIELFKKGGGAFLWFIPGIMIFYLIAPILLWIKEKLKSWGLLFIIAVWLLVALFLEYIVGYTDIFILLNRLPIFALGMYYEDIRERVNGVGPVLTVPVLLIGAVFIYLYAGQIRLGKPITDIYYIIAIPFVASLISLIDYLCINGMRELRFLNFVGGFTLELYAVQMIFGFNIENMLFKLLFSNKLLAFLATAICLMAISYLLSICKKFFVKLIRKEK